MGVYPEENQGVVTTRGGGWWDATEARSKWGELFLKNLNTFLFFKPVIKKVLTKKLKYGTQVLRYRRKNTLFGVHSEGSKEEAENGRSRMIIIKG